VRAETPGYRLLPRQLILPKRSVYSNVRYCSLLRLRPFNWVSFPFLVESKQSCIGNHFKLHPRSFLQFSDRTNVQLSDLLLQEKILHRENCGRVAKYAVAPSSWETRLSFHTKARAAFRRNLRQLNGYSPQGLASFLLFREGASRG